MQGTKEHICIELACSMRMTESLPAQIKFLGYHECLIDLLHLYSVFFSPPPVLSVTTWKSIREGKKLRYGNKKEVPLKYRTPSMYGEAPLSHHLTSRDFHI